MKHRDVNVVRGSIHSLVWGKPIHIDNLKKIIHVYGINIKKKFDPDLFTTLHE